MKFSPTNTAKLCSHAARTLAAAGVIMASGLGLSVLTESAANAQSGSDETMISDASWLNIAVRGGSTSAGTDIIQWWADGGGEQQWNAFGYSGVNGGYYQNINSGLCITTDGVAGDPLTQEPCSENNVYQRWVSSYVWWAFGYTLYNPASGLNMDVQNFSYWGGAEIDGWYPNNQLNQVFSTPGGGSLS